MSHTSSPESTPNCTQGQMNQLPTVDWDEFKYRQLYWAPIVEVYTIAVPLNAPHHNVINWDYYLQITTYRSMVTASMVIDRFIIELSTLMAAEKSSAPIGTRDASPATTTIITGTGFDLINNRNRIPFLRVNWVRPSAREATMDEMCRRHGRRQSWVQDSTLLTREIEYHSYMSIERDHQSENIQSMAGSYPWIGNTENCRRSRETIPSLDIVYTYNSSNLEEASRTATAKSMRRVSEWRREEMQLATIHLWTCG